MEEMIHVTLNRQKDEDGKNTFIQGVYVPGDDFLMLRRKQLNRSKSLKLINWA